MQIYLDYSATTPCRPEASAAMHAVLTQGWGNPASLHEWGRRAAFTVEQARWQVAQLIGASAESIVFTSGGTEANNLALQGVARHFRQPQHLIISSVEHPAVANTALELELQGWQVSRLPVNRAGRVNPEDLTAALQPNTVLVSIIYGQSEVGTVQTIATLGAIAQRHGAIFHTDAVQAVGRLPIDVSSLPIDLLSLSSHKLYGPQGSGALYVKPGTPLRPLLEGGGQEQGLRSGTPAVANLAGFGAAAACALTELQTEPQRLATLRDRLIHQLQDLEQLEVTGDLQNRLPHHASFCIALPLLCQSENGISGRVLVKQMDLAGIAISAGSACHSGKTQPSDVLTAMGYSPEQAQTGVRLTLGHATTLEDIDWAAMALKQILFRLTAKTATAALI